MFFFFIISLVIFPNNIFTDRLDEKEIDEWEKIDHEHGGHPFPDVGDEDHLICGHIAFYENEARAYLPTNETVSIEMEIQDTKNLEVFFDFDYHCEEEKRIIKNNFNISGEGVCHVIYYWNQFDNSVNMTLRQVGQKGKRASLGNEVLHEENHLPAKISFQDNSATVYILTGYIGSPESTVRDSEIPLQKPCWKNVEENKIRFNISIGTFESECGMELVLRQLEPTKVLSMKKNKKKCPVNCGAFTKLEAKWIKECDNFHDEL